jgi:hypothetical protein
VNKNQIVSASVTSDCRQINVWTSSVAKGIAREISAISGVYCGPATVGWIAAVWNFQKGIPYDYKTRLKDKDLFPDGPRAFRLNVPGFELNLSDLLRRETQNELKLSDESYFHFSTIHDSLLRSEMPVVVRMRAPNLVDGLHYVTVYQSERKLFGADDARIQMYWQDNGLRANRFENNPALTRTKWTKTGPRAFVLGAKQVVKV